MIETSEGRREGTKGGEKNQSAREDHMLQSSSMLFMNVCPDEAPEGSVFLEQLIGFILEVGRGGGSGSRRTPILIDL